jgi:hypothetical protein
MAPNAARTGSNPGATNPPAGSARPLVVIGTSSTSVGHRQGQELSSVRASGEQPCGPAR